MDEDIPESFGGWGCLLYMATNGEVGVLFFFKKITLLKLFLPGLKKEARSLPKVGPKHQL